jgi:hypothetical protein
MPVVLVLLAGCAGVFGPHVNYLPAAGDLPAVPIERVAVIDATTEELALRLPVGVSIGYGSHVSARRVIVEAPHVLVGQLTAGLSSSGSLDELRAALIAEAASHGATAVILTKMQDNRNIDAGFRGEAAAIVLAHQATARPAAELLAETVATLASGFQDAGEPIRRSLEHPEPFSLKVERGQCYAVAFALAPDARLDPQRYPGFTVNTRVAIVPRTDAVFGATEKAMALLRSYSSELGCPTAGGEVTLSFEQLEGPRGSKEIEPIGRGEIEFHVYRRVYGDAELRSRVAERANRLNRACRDCERTLDGCYRPRASLCEEYARCIETAAPEFHLGAAECPAKLRDDASRL